MTQTKWTPEEFERLLALPSDHPDRRDAEASLAFQARLRMQQTFETPTLGEFDTGELARVREALSVRLERALELPIPRPASATPVAPAAGEPAASARSPLGPLSAWLASPRLRPALAFAAVLVIAGLGWLSLDRGPARREVRGTTPESAALSLALPVVRPEGVELAWNAVPGVESYRLVFFDQRFAELARIEGLAVTRVVLSGDALPSGLTHGADVELEVQAILHDDVVARSPIRSLRVP